MTYVAGEPEPVTAYPDVTGKLHHTREDAIEANFNADLSDAVVNYCTDNLGRFGDMPAIATLRFIKGFAKEHPDMLRILIGDRDYT